MSHSQFHCTGRVYLDLHGLSFETSICYWQDQPGSLPRQTEPIPGKGPALVCLSTGGSPVGTPPVILVGGAGYSQPARSQQKHRLVLKATGAYLGAQTLSEASLDATSFLRDDRSEKTVCPMACAWTG